MRYEFADDSIPDRKGVFLLGVREMTTTMWDPRVAALRAPVSERWAMDWRHDSACRDEDPELFFPIGNTGPALAQIEEAKAVCARCPVQDPCLQWALESGQDAGVWGGLSEDERRALKRRAARNRARTA